ncbi:MAG: phage tail protein [Bacteroidota bacterium]
MADYYPPVSFHFRVDFLDLKGQEHDVKFQSVTGLNVQFETETIKEGGENRFEHVVPGRTKYPDLVLNRGVIPAGSSAVADWILEAVQNFDVKPINLQVVLLNEKHEPLMYWKIIHAWPKSWKFSDLKADKGEVFVETISLNYNRFEFKV